MKVKINDKVYNSNDIPILLVLSEDDRKNLINMFEDKNALKYCSYPSKGYTNEEIEKFMEIA